MKQRSKATKNRRARSSLTPLEAEIEEIRTRAHMVGIRLAGERLTSWLPQARCTPEQRERAQALADAAGISLSDHIVRRAIADDNGALVVE